MNMIPVVSSNLSAVGYESRTLYVRFNDGSLYSYDNIPVEVYQGLMNASSKGQYLATFVKGRYPYRRIG